MKRLLLKIAAGLMTCTLAAFVVHDALLFDADRFVREHREAMTEKIWADTAAGRSIEIDVAALASRATKWHLGEPPCHAYAPPRPEPAAISAMVDEMVAAGVLRQANATLAIWAGWASLDERERHGEPRDEEVLSSVLFGAGPRERFLVALHRGAVIAAGKRASRTADQETKRRIEAREAKVAPEDLLAAYNFWHAHRLVLSIPALSQLRREMDARAKQATQ